MDPVVGQALRLLQGGEPERAGAVLSGPDGPVPGGPGAAGSLRAQLARYLSTPDSGRVYDAPAAFRAFVSGGGNVGLYAATVDRLAAGYRSAGVRRVLDLGCGDGRAVLPAAARLRPPPELDLVEPSAALLDGAVEAAAGLGLPVRAHHGTAEDFLGAPPDDRWDLAEATFALHALPPDTRSRVLAALRPRARRLLLVEFDVPEFAEGSPEQVRYLADHYERGLAEYAADGGLVAQGFLLPVLVGQLAPGRVRSTWEQPAQRWAAQVAGAGWVGVTVEHLADYWWAPAVTVTAVAPA